MLGEWSKKSMGVTCELGLMGLIGGKGWVCGLSSFSILKNIYDFGGWFVELSISNQCGINSAEIKTITS